MSIECVESLKLLMSRYQVATVSALSPQRLLVFLQHLEFRGVVFDAVYHDRRQWFGSPQDYSQIVKDFEIPSDTIAQRVLVLFLS